MASPALRDGDVLAGKYRIERVIGQGGMGLVLAASHLELEQPVAVKVLHPDLAERGEAAARFRREARAAAKIRSEHVVRVLDVGMLDGGGAYMVMEYLEGNDLADELERRTRLPLEEAMEFILQACEAVAEAHRAGIVHRDLKPANLFLARRLDGSRTIKVLDFGISKSVSPGSSSDPSLTNASTLMGSPIYMSPEQMRSARDVDARTDIWALGILLFEMLAGTAPFGGESVPQICTALLNDPPPPLQRFRNDVPPELEAVIVRCLEKDREKRWPSVGALAMALAPFAPPALRVHARRANRDQAASESIPGTVVSGEDGAIHTERTAPATLTLLDGSVSAHDAATLASVATTGAGKKRGNSALYAVFAVLLAGLAAVITIVFLKHEPPAAPTQVAIPSSPVAPAEPPPVVTAVSPVEPIEPAAGEPVPSGTAPSTSPSAAAALLATNKPAGSGSAHHAAKASASAKTPSGKLPSTMTDFGGRR